MLAIIRSGGKQYLVSEGTRVKLEKLTEEDGAKVRFDALYAGDDASAEIGTPTLTAVTVEGKVLRQARHEKVVGVKHKPKKRYKMTFGHKQPFTEVEIVKISKK